MDNGYNNNSYGNSYSNDNTSKKMEFNVNRSRATVQFPDVFIIGERKAATTSLRELLTTRLDGKICRTEKPELHFFDKQWNYERGGNYYRSLFAACKSGQLTLDTTPG